MSTQKKTQLIFVVLFVTAFAACMAQEADPADPVLAYYCRQAAGQAESRDPLMAGVAYSIHVKSYLSKLKSRGRRELADSAVYTDFYSFGVRDSQIVAAATDESLLEVDLTFPNVFSRDYVFRFFPNDTGGQRLAIGFDSDTVTNLSPVGLAIVDRNAFFLRSLYLYYPHEEKYERYSRQLDFTEVDGFTIPEKIVTTYARASIMSLDYWQVETYIDSVRVYR